MTPPVPALIVTAAGIGWVILWALWRFRAERRAAHLVLALSLGAGVAALVQGATGVQILAGLAVLALAVRLLMTDRGPGRLTAAAALVAGLLLAGGTPRPW